MSNARDSSMHAPGERSASTTTAGSGGRPAHLDPRPRRAFPFLRQRASAPRPPVPSNTVQPAAERALRRARSRATASRMDCSSPRRVNQRSQPDGKRSQARSRSAACSAASRPNRGPSRLRSASERRSGSARPSTPRQSRLDGRELPTLGKLCMEVFRSVCHYPDARSRKESVALALRTARGLP